MVSVIVPVYNAELYLRECIESILTQTYENIELILVNDGSKDNSLSICKSFEPDTRVIVIDKPNGGVSTARNEGLKVCNGEYVTFVDSDDTIPSDAIASLVTGMVEGVDEVVGQFWWQYDDKIVVRKHRRKLGVSKRDELLSRFIDDGTLSGFLISSNCCTLYKKDLINRYNIRFMESLKINEDGLFNFEYFIRSKGVNVVQNHVYTTRKHFGSSSTARPRNYDFNTIVCNRISELEWDKERFDCDKQIARRSLTVLIWNIVLYSRIMKMNEFVLYLKEEVAKIDIKKSFSLLNMKGINRYKRIILLFIKLKFYRTIYFLGHSVIPFLQTRVRR